MSDAGPSRLKIAVIGCGRVGAVLAAAWHRSGHRIVGVTARSDMSRLRAEALVPHAPIVDRERATADADLVLLSVPDQVIGDLVPEMVAEGSLSAGQFVVHTAGRYGLGVLEPAAQVGAIPLAIHPALPLTGTSVDLDRLAGAAFGVTAPPSMRSVAEALVVEIGGEPVWIPEEAREGYHAALAFAANYAMTLVNESVGLLTESGAEDPGRILGPLVRASVETALERGDRGQTGPIVRADAGAIDTHLDYLDHAAPLAGQAYRSLGRLTVDRLLAAGILNASQASAVLTSLEAQR